MMPAIVEIARAEVLAPRDRKSTGRPLPPGLRRLLAGRPRRRPLLRRRHAAPPAHVRHGLADRERPPLLAAGRARDLPGPRLRVDRAPAGRAGRRCRALDTFLLCLPGSGSFRW